MSTEINIYFQASNEGNFSTISQVLNYTKYMYAKVALISKNYEIFFRGIRLMRLI